MKKILFSTSALFAIVGCSQPPPPPPVPTPIPTPAYLSHTVSFPGENLGKIAKWYTGDVDNWKAIAQANPDLNPKKLLMGDQISIPTSLVTNREPMPKKFVTPSNRPVSRKKAETFVVDEVENVKEAQIIEPTPRPIITAPSEPVAVATAVPVVEPTVIPTVLPLIPSEPQAPSEPTKQADSTTSSAPDTNNKSVEDLVAEEKKVLEQLQKEFQADSGLAPQ